MDILSSATSARRPTRHQTPTIVSFSAALTLFLFCAPGSAFADDPHEDSHVAHETVFSEDRFPPATACKTCHPEHYREWSVSQHSYAQLSPVFNAMQAKLLRETSGSLGDFCIRCHTPVGMTLSEPVEMDNFARAPAAREGVTCIVCHRVDKAYGKVSGRRVLAEGDLLTPVKGPTGSDELSRVLSLPSKYRVVTNEVPAGRKIHAKAERFFQLTTSDFCGSCHDVTLPNGLRLEEAFSEFKNSPAAQRGERCQDCHMGVEPGRNSGYAFGPAADVGGEPTRPRKRTNHMFPGPDHSIIHPGLFPHNTKARELATVDEWLSFDYKSGWGTDAFERHVTEADRFPSRWRSVDDRYDARTIIDGQLALLGEMREKRLAILQAGFQLGEIELKRAGRSGLKFSVPVRNGIDGHNVPTGFDVERLVYLEVTVTDALGKVLFRSGDLDPNGDLRDIHSEYVMSGAMERDKQLFNLQSKFLVAGIRGGEHEAILAINRSVDPLPFIRPERYSTTLTGRPKALRIHRRTIPPAGVRRADYRVKGRELSGHGPYHVTAKLKAGMVPANLVRVIADSGFQYGLTEAEVVREVVEGHLVLWERNLTVDLHSGETTAARAGESNSGRVHED